LPEFKKDKQYDDEHEENQRKFGFFVMKFLEHVFSAPNLRFSKFLQRFVGDALPVSAWIKQIEEERPKKIDEFRTAEGAV
jgi:hypothetical protein